MKFKVESTYLSRNKKPTNHPNIEKIGDDWFIDINCLPDLLEFEKYTRTEPAKEHTHGNSHVPTEGIIVTQDKDQWTIEIYDGYRE